MSLLKRIPKNNNLCVFCKYYQSRADCDVFKFFGKFIPPEILKLEFDHRYPHPEDGGIQFEMLALDRLQHRKPFRSLSFKLILKYFESTKAYLEAHHPDNIPPTNDGHLPYIWFIDDN